MGKLIDLTGKRFGRWTVLERAENQVVAGKTNVFWKCRCECGTERDVNGNALRRGVSRSCGCWQKENVKQICETRRKQNDFLLDRDTVYIKTSKGNILCDLKDWDKLKGYYWYIASDGYPSAFINGKSTKLHVFLLDCPPGYERDHIDGNKADNRRKNLRIVPAYANRFNKGLSRRNKSGHTGVFWYEKYKKYQVYIQANKKQIFLGYYEDYDEAVKVREKAEEVYFGNYRRKNLQA